MALSVVSLRCRIWSAIGAYRTSSSNQARFMGTRPKPRLKVRRRPIRSIVARSRETPAVAAAPSHHRQRSPPAFRHPIDQALLKPRHLERLGLLDEGHSVVADRIDRGFRIGLVCRSGGDRPERAVVGDADLARGSAATPRDGPEWTPKSNTARSIPGGRLSPFTWSQNFPR